jgi:hypothetical protein
MQRRDFIKLPEVLAAFTNTDGSGDRDHGSKGMADILANLYDVYLMQS